MDEAVHGGDAVTTSRNACGAAGLRQRNGGMPAFNLLDPGRHMIRDGRGRNNCRFHASQGWIMLRLHPLDDPVV